MRHHILTALIIAAFAMPLAACKEEGAMEKAGKKMDEATQSMNEAIDEMQDEIED
jgi:hypothetical protein